MKSVLLTGATGFIGLHLTDLLLSCNYNVSLFIRKRNPAIENFEKRGAKVILGSFDSKESLASAIKNIDVVIHNAGATMALREEEYIKVNAQYTKNILDLINKNQKFIFVSSQAAAGPSSLDTPITEDSPAKPVSYYGKSKLAAESYILDWGKKNDNNFIIIRPSSVFGPGDKEFLPWFKSIYKRVEPILIGGVKAFSIIYVKDLIQAILKAVESEKKGQIYFAAGDTPCSDKILGNEIKKTFGISFVPKIYIPLTFLSLLVKVFEKFYKKPFLLNSQKLLEIKQKAWLVDNSKIKRDLGWKPQYTFESAIKETAEYFLAHRKEI